VRRAADEELKRLSGALATSLAGDLFAPGALETLLELGQHSSWAVRDSAIHALGQVFVAAKKAAKKGEENRDTASRVAAEAASIAKAAAEKATANKAEAEAVAKGDPKAKPDAAALEKAQADAAALEELATEAAGEQQVAENREAAERRKAKAGADEMEMAEKVAAGAFRGSLALVNDPSSKVRLSVAKALGTAIAAGGAPPATLQALRALVLDTEDDVRSLAANGLAKATGHSRAGAARLMLEFVENKAWRIRTDIAHAFGMVESDHPCASDILAALQKLCKDDINDVRSAAAGSLKGMKIMALFNDEWHPGVIKQVLEEDPVWKRWLVQLENEPKGPPRHTKRIKALHAEATAKR